MFLVFIPVSSEAHRIRCDIQKWHQHGSKTSGMIKKCPEISGVPG